MSFGSHRIALLAGCVLLSACAASPPQGAQRPPGAPQPQVRTTPEAPAALAPVEFALAATDFSAIPGWNEADLAPPLLAFKRSCQSLRARTPDAPLAGGRYGGVVRDWLPACDRADTILPGQERWFFETYFAPSFVIGPGEARLTAYYEPVIEARRQPDAEFSEPLLRRPADMVTVDLSAFASAREDEALRGAPRALTGRLAGDRVEPYPKREAIAPQPGQAIAWAHPADVYNLQVQGSGRLRFPDGEETRAAFAAQNGYRWISALGSLRSAGMLSGATWGAFRMWLDSNPGAARGALNADPSYVFFSEEPISDPLAGPRGAANVPLTALGSIAVDPAYHPYGAIVFVDGAYDGGAFRRLLVAQDTGGAIRRGPLRGDVFFGSGPVAGIAAERMNTPAQWWTLLPRPVETPIASLRFR